MHLYLKNIIIINLNKIKQGNMLVLQNVPKGDSRRTNIAITKTNKWAENKVFSNSSVHYKTI